MDALTPLQLSRSVLIESPRLLLINRDSSPSRAFSDSHFDLRISYRRFRMEITLGLICLFCRAMNSVGRLLGLNLGILGDTGFRRSD